MDIQTKHIDSAVRAVRKASLKAFETAANRCLSIFPDAEKNPPTARLVLNIISSQAQESLDLFLRQFEVALDQSIGDNWQSTASAEIEDMVKKLEVGLHI